jgi:DNA invertase Pin-like site-specific DNA recombinase
MDQRSVAAYYRVSVARDDMKAPELYEDEITRYCRFRNLELAEIFSDIDYSGYNNSEKRPALNDLVTRRAEFSAVIIPKLSRFGRSLKHLTELFGLFDRDGISLVFLDMNIDSSTSQGRLLRHIMAAFAEYESDVKADYARANYRHAMRDGRAWGKPPFGYRTESKNYVPVEEEAALIRRIYSRYLDGASLYGIATELNAEGSLKRGFLWRINHLGRVLDNPAYSGITVLDGEIFDATWDAIVDRATWDEVQRQRLPENRGQRARKVGTGGPYLLSGVIVCGTCGRNAHHHRKKTRRRSDSSAYRCMAMSESASCTGGGVGRVRADGIVTDDVLRRVRFSLEGAEFASARDAWDHASLAQRRRVLNTVIERVVIEPRAPGEAHTCPRRLRVEWKPDFTDAELVVTPLQEIVTTERPTVRVGRPESHRADREVIEARRKAARSEAARRRMVEWNEFRAERIRWRG